MDNNKFEAKAVTQTQFVEGQTQVVFNCKK